MTARPNNQRGPTDQPGSLATALCGARSLAGLATVICLSWLIPSPYPWQTRSVRHQIPSRFLRSALRYHPSRICCPLCGRGPLRGTERFAWGDCWSVLRHRVLNSPPFKVARCLFTIHVAGKFAETPLGSMAYLATEGAFGLRKNESMFL